MDKKLLQRIGINETTSSKELINQLEEKQLEYLERIENATDNKRKIELHKELQKIEKCIEDVELSISALNMGIVIDKSSDSEKLDEHEKKEELNSEVEKIKKKYSKKEQGITSTVKERSEKDDSIEGSKVERTPAINTKSYDELGDLELFGPNVTDGVKAFKSEDYNKAFTIFKDLSEDKNSDAQLWLGYMYESGLGTKEDMDRAKFWYKTSIDTGNVDALFYYSLALIKEKAPKSEVIVYLDKACKENHFLAMKLYVDLFEQNDFDDKNYFTNAIHYCDIICEQESDSYIKKGYQEKKKKIIKLASDRKVFNIIRLIQNSLLIVGMLYAYLGCRYTDTFGISLIKAPIVPIKWEFLDKLLHGVFTDDGIFGLVLLFVGIVLCGFNDKYEIPLSKYNLVLGKLTGLMLFCIPVWQFIRIFKAHASWKTQLGFVFLSLLVLFIGYVLGNILPGPKKYLRPETEKLVQNQ